MRGKATAEVAGLLLLAGSAGVRGVCGGASLILGAHAAFWWLGAATSRVDEEGRAAPVPRELSRVLLAADTLLLAPALLGVLAPTRAGRAVGAWLVSLLVGAVCVQKLPAFRAAGKEEEVEEEAVEVAEAEEDAPSDGGSTSASRGGGATMSLATVEAERVATSEADEDPAELYGNQWWPLAFSSSSDRTKPISVQLLGAPLVLWWDHTTSAWRAALDRCPHRLSPLSEGRIRPDDGAIECPYHGWAFRGQDGACVSIPTLADDARIDDARACATALPVTEQQGMVWVWAGALYEGGLDSPPAGRETPDTFAVEPIERDDVAVMDYSRDLFMDAATLCENVMDPAHLPFTHHGTISKRSAAQPIPFSRLTPLSRDGFTLDRPTEGWPGKVTFKAPSLVLAETHRPDGGFSDWNVVYAVPTAPGRCRILVRVAFEVGAMKPPLKWVITYAFRYQPRWLTHLSNHVILEDDNVFLHAQGRSYRVPDGDAEKVAAAGAQAASAAALCPGWSRRLHMPTTADGAVRTWHTWLDKYTGGAGAPWSKFTPAASFVAASLASTRHDVLERRGSHVEHCTYCSGALRNAKSLRALTDALVVIGLLADGLIAPRASRARGVLLAAAAFAVGRVCGEVERRLTSGKVTPPRNA